MKLNEEPRVSREGLRVWYDGYHTYSGERVYSPRSAVSSLLNNNYLSARDFYRIDGKIATEPKYTGRILAVGISYDKQTKRHACKVQEI